jgi:hypothetical protein
MSHFLNILVLRLVYFGYDNLDLRSTTETPFSLFDKKKITNGLTVKDLMLLIIKLVQIYYKPAHESIFK